MGFLKRLLINRYTASIIRHGMTALGGFLLAKGIATPEMIEQFITSGTEVFIGLSVFIVGQLLSWLDKSRN